MRMLIVYYSTFGHMYELAKEIAAGAKEVGADVKIKRVPELVPTSIVESRPRLKAGVELQKDVPVAEVAELADYDAIVFGSPTRYGNMAAQMKNFIDQTGPLWAKGKLVNKVGGVFSGSSSMHGGQETTLITMMIPLMHHGMIIVPAGYVSPEVDTTQSGGTPYGPTAVAGAESMRPVDQVERKIARDFGRRIAEITKLLTRP
ncbi:MAG: NAD(P)H:quinone oxidoreductase [Candidatus Thorarchaeota archaeon]|nr:MAG: NAD(P)H:quinone oxidoreductase [Candidatus Thorarchaeota archaeon]